MTRKFCAAVSWSGQARSANVLQNINSSANKKLIEAFSNVVALASSDANDAGIQEFFSSSIFRNANARLNHKKYRNAATVNTPAPARKRKLAQQAITDTTDTTDTAGTTATDITDTTGTTATDVTDTTATDPADFDFAAENIVQNILFDDENGDDVEVA